MRLLTTLLFLLASVLSGPTLSAQDCEHPDFSALMAFYESTNGEDWTDNTGWADGAAGTNCEPCSGWRGVTCNDGERVTSIILSSNNLSGSLPESIGDLSELHSIGIAVNNIEGQIPSSIGNLSNLVTLTAQYNRLSGPLPQTIGDLTSLVQFIINSNQLNGTLPSSISNLTSLQEFSISGKTTAPT